MPDVQNVPCSECNSHFPDLYSFRLQNFVCVIGKCDRKFSQYYAFRKHAVSVHHVLAFVDEASQKPFVCISNSNSCETSEIFEEYDNSVDNVCDKDIVCNVEDLLMQDQDYLVAKLYSNPAIPRNMVGHIIDNFSKYLTSPFFENMRHVVTLSLDPNLSLATKQEIEKMFDITMNPFPHLQTEFKRLKYFEANGEYIPPVTYEIYSGEERVKTKDGVVLKMMKVTGEFIPLRKVFTKFFHLPHAFEDTLSYMQSLLLKKDWLFNLVQCDVWKRKVASFGDDVIVLPLNLYFDEVEPNSALGPHCEPLGCTYVQIAALPPEWRSRLENIFLALLFNAHDRSLYGNYRAFKPLLEELKFLEKEGIVIVTKEKGPVRVHIVVAWILGDNKGLNGICGFMEGFTANYFCRICHVTKADSEQMFEEDVTLLRTSQNYLLDVAKNDSTKTGIKEKCIFNKLPSFETPSDICVDEFHDLSEGVAHYDMVAILKHFHRLNDMFIPTLNSRLYALDLGVDNDNRPPGISTDRLLTKSKLKMTGAEMYMFVRIFGVLVYDMIPVGDPFYNMYLLLNDIMSIIHAKSLPRDAAAILSVTVKEHNQLYVDLTKDTLKPKHHFLLHYSSLLLKMGPFSGVSSIRFEAKHRMLKLTAESCMSRVNLPKTVAIKQQLGFCLRVVANASIRQPLIAGPEQTVNLSELDSFPSLRRSLPCDIVENPIQTVVNWVDFKGSKYQPQQILLTDVDDGLFQFGKIQLILIYDGEPLFICSPLDTLGYFSEVRGYEVIPLHSWFAIRHGKLLDYHPLCLYPMPSGETVVVLCTVL